MKDEKGQEYLKVFKKGEVGYRDYAPVAAKLKSQLSLGPDEEI